MIFEAHEVCRYEGKQYAILIKRGNGYVIIECRDHNTGRIIEGVQLSMAEWVNLVAAVGSYD